MSNISFQSEFVVCLGAGNNSAGINTSELAGSQELVTMANRLVLPPDINNVIIDRLLPGLGEVANRLSVHEQTVNNPTEAWGLALRGIEKAIVFTGRGSDPNAIYAITEAEAMSRWFAALKSTEPHGIGNLTHTNVELESKSSDTFENIENIGDLLEEYSPNEITFVGSKPHAQRAATIAKAYYGNEYEYLVHNAPGEEILTKRGLIRAIQLRAANRAYKKSPNDYTAFKAAYERMIPDASSIKSALGI